LVAAALFTGWVLLVQPIASAAANAAQSDIGFFCIAAKILIPHAFCKVKLCRYQNYFPVNVVSVPIEQAMMFFPCCLRVRLYHGTKGCYKQQGKPEPNRRSMGF
jgi:hypothetical protein